MESSPVKTDVLTTESRRQRLELHKINHLLTYLLTYLNGYDWTMWLWFTGTRCC